MVYYTSKMNQKIYTDMLTHHGEKIERTSQGTASWHAESLYCVKPQAIHSKKTLSSCEAEYTSLSEAVKEGRYVQTLCRFLNLNIEKYTMYEDNQSAIAVASNNESRRGKSIDIRYHSEKRSRKKR